MILSRVLLFKIGSLLLWMLWFPLAQPSAPRAASVSVHRQGTAPPSSRAPVPLLAKGHPVDWWFVFKLNAKAFPGCGGGTQACPFGGTVFGGRSFGQQYVYASSEHKTLQQGGKDCVGDTTNDPVGATFAEVYTGSFNYVVWNDQTYQDPKIDGCSGDGCDGPWGHSKGVLAWNEAGEGFVMQVSTPSWPAAASLAFPRRTDGNTLGCIKDNNVEVSQHFFALKLTEPDLVAVLKGMINASVVTDPDNPQIVRNGGPDEVQALVKGLGNKSLSTEVQSTKLSSGVRLISKPSDLNVPPWQMVSAALGGVSLRVASWWAFPQIDSTTASSPIECWSPTLGKAGAVQIATSGSWRKKKFSLRGESQPDGNHAKVGVSTSGKVHYAIFGDENQQGSLSGKCERSQNGRSGMFFAVNDAKLAKSVGKLLAGDSAGTRAAP